MKALVDLIGEAMFEFEEKNGSHYAMENAQAEAEFIAKYILASYEIKDRNLNLFEPTPVRRMIEMIEERMEKLTEFISVMKREPSIGTKQPEARLSELESLKKQIEGDKI